MSVVVRSLTESVSATPAVPTTLKKPWVEASLTTGVSVVTVTAASLSSGWPASGAPVVFAARNTLPVPSSRTIPVPENVAPPVFAATTANASGPSYGPVLIAPSLMIGSRTSSVPPDGIGVLAANSTQTEPSKNSRDVPKSEPLVAVPGVAASDATFCPTAPTIEKIACDEASFTATVAIVRGRSSSSVPVVVPRAPPVTVPE